MKNGFPVTGHQAIKVRNPSEVGNRRGGPWDGPSDWLKGSQAKVKGGGIQADPRALLSGGDEPTVQGDRVVPACRSECARESCTEMMPAVGRGPSSPPDAWKSEPHEDAQAQTRWPDARGRAPVPTRQEGHHRAHRTLERGLMVFASVRGK